MSGHYDRLIRQTEDALVQGAQNLLVGSTREIRAPNAPGKQCVPGDQLLFERKVNTNASFGVAGCVDDLSFDLSGAYAIGLPNAAIDFDFPRSRHADPRRLHIEHLQQCIVILVQENGCPGCGAQLCRTADMIDVGVRDDDLLDLELVLVDEPENLSDVVPGIDDDGLARRLVANDGAVALQRANGKDLVDHNDILVVRRATEFAQQKRSSSRGDSFGNLEYATSKDSAAMPGLTEAGVDSQAANSYCSASRPTVPIPKNSTRRYAERQKSRA